MSFHFREYAYGVVAYSLFIKTLTNGLKGYILYLGTRFELNLLGRGDRGLMYEVGFIFNGISLLFYYPLLVATIR